MHMHNTCLYSYIYNYTLQFGPWEQHAYDYSQTAELNAEHAEDYRKLLKISASNQLILQ